MQTRILYANDEADFREALRMVVVMWNRQPGDALDPAIERMLMARYAEKVETDEECIARKQEWANEWCEIYLPLNEKPSLSGGKMNNIGNTRRWVIRCLHQYFTFAATGGEVVMSSPHPDVAGNAHAATFSVVSEFGEVKPEPDVAKALELMAGMAWAVGAGDFVSVEKLSADIDGEERYVVAIKKAE
jgi:hypothetical protein